MAMDWTIYYEDERGPSRKGRARGERYGVHQGSEIFLEFFLALGSLRDIPEYTLDYGLYYAL